MAALTYGRPKKPSAAAHQPADEAVDACREWAKSWAVQTVKRGSTDASAAAQAAKALAPLASTVTAATNALRHRAGGRASALASIAVACGDALHGLLPALLPRLPEPALAAALADLAAIAHCAPGALRADAAAALVALLVKGGGATRGGDIGERAAALLERCVVAGSSVRASDLRSPLASHGYPLQFVRQMERFCSASSSPDATVAHTADEPGGCPLRAQLSLLATLASASAAIAADVLTGDAGAGSDTGGEADDTADEDRSVAAAARFVRALAGVHAACAIHDPAREAAVRLLIAVAAAPAFGRMLASDGCAAERARGDVLGVLHSVLRRHLSLPFADAGDVRLWARAAAVAAAWQLWQPRRQGSSGGARCQCCGDRASACATDDETRQRWRRGIAESAARMACRPSGAGGLGGDTTGAAARLLAAAQLAEGGRGVAPRAYGDKRRPARRGPDARAGWDAGGYVLADALAYCALWGGSGGGGAASAAADGASRAAWAVLRASMLEREAGKAASGGGGGVDALPLLFASPALPGPGALVRAFLCVSARVGAAGEGRARAAAINPLAAAEIAAALRQPAPSLPRGAARPLPRLLAHAAWRALGAAAGAAANTANDAEAPGPSAATHAACAARLAAAALTAGAKPLFERRCGASASDAETLAIAEALLAAASALVLLASASAGNNCVATAALVDGSSGDGVSWCSALDGSQPSLRSALEALVLLPECAAERSWRRAAMASSSSSSSSSSNKTGVVGSTLLPLDGPSLDDCLVASVFAELRCAAAAALSLLFGQLGAPPPAGGAARSALARDSAPPDVELVGAGGWSVSAHAVALSAASPVLRERLRAAAAENVGGGRPPPPLRVRLSGAVDRAALEVVLDVVYAGVAHLPGAGCLQQPQQQCLGNAVDRSQVHALARALQVGQPLAALCLGAPPRPGDSLPSILPDYRALAPSRAAVLLPLESNHPTAPLDAADAAGAHGLSARHYLLAAHHLVQAIPACAAAPSGARDAFADVLLAAPVVVSGAGAPTPAAVLLPAHRLLLSAAGPYLSAATSARWAGGGDGSSSGCGCGGGGGCLATLVPPDADADVAHALARWLYGSDDALDFLSPPSLPALDEPLQRGGAADDTACRDDRCRRARLAARLRHCADLLLLPALTAACDGALLGLLAALAPRPRCLLAALRDCAELGLAAGADAAARQLVRALAVAPAPAAAALRASDEWAALPCALQQAVEGALSRRALLNDDDDDDGGADADLYSGADAGSSGAQPRGPTAASLAADAAAGGLDALEAALRDFAAAAARG